MPSEEKKRQLYLAANMAELQKFSEVKQLTTNARILAKTADKMFREAESCKDQGDEERAFVLYMKYFNVIKQVKTSAEYKKNKQYFDNLIGQKNQVGAIENAEKLSDSLKERYDFREAEAVAKKFASLDMAETKMEKADEPEGDGKKEEKGGKKTSSTDENGETSSDSAPAASLTPIALCELLRDASSQLLLMDVRAEADFVESHINHPSCISVPQEAVPPGTTVTHIEGQLPEESRALWKQRGNVDHIVLLDWSSGLESLTIGTTLRTLKDALFKYDSTVIVKSEPLVLEGGYDQWLVFYPTMTTNARVARPPAPATTVSSITSLDFDYPDFDEKPSTHTGGRNGQDAALADSLAEFVQGDAITVASMSGTMPRFDRSLKPRGSSGTIADALAKPGTLNNARSTNLARESRSGEGISMVSNTLYPSIGPTKKGEKNTNIYNDLQRPPAGSGSGSADTTVGTNDSPSNKNKAPRTSQQEEEEERSRLQELEEKRRREEKLLADLMRKKRHVEQEMKETERRAAEERELAEGKDKAVREKEELERRRLAEVERLRQERKKKEMEEQAEREKQDNLAKEKALSEARDRARQEESEREAAQAEAKEHAEKLRQEQEDSARQEVAARQQQEEDLARQKKADEEATARQRQQEEEKKRKEAEDEKRHEAERQEKERAEAARKEEQARKARQAEEERQAAARLEEERRETARKEEERRQAAKQEEAQRLAAKKAEEERLAAEKERAAKAAAAQQDSLRRAQEPKMVPSPSLPTGWEKRLDAPTNRYYYIDHNRGVTQWEPPHNSRPVPAQVSGTYTTRLKEEPAVSSRGLTRSHSSPDIMKQLADEARATDRPVYDRRAKPSTRPMDMTPLKPAARPIIRRDLNPVWGNVGSALTGLRNLGNTCYMNSTVQCLNNTSPLVSYFLNDTYHQDINRHSVEGMNGEVVDDFAVVVKALWSGQYRCITPRDLKVTVGKYNPMFAGYQQQDSQEFLTFLLDGLHEGLNEIKKRPQIPEQDNDRLQDHEAARLAWENHKLLHRSIIVELFQGQLKSTLMCRTCRKKSVTFQAFMYISLPISASSRCSLRDCFRAFLQPEMMTGSCKWKCPQCRVERDAEKKIDIWKLPHILLIGLNRFVSDGMWMQKKTTYVDFPVTDLDLGEFMIGPKHRSRYNLYGVSNHYGTMEGGHYTAFCRNPCTSKWYKFDDHEVYEMSKSDVKTSAAFVLYYTSIELTAPQFKPQL